LIRKIFITLILLTVSFGTGVSQNTTVNFGQTSDVVIPSDSENGVEYAPLAEEQIPDVLIPFDSEGGTEYAIVVEKETQQLFLYAHDGTLREVFRTACSTGKKFGPKTREGDLKTPEGIYFFIKIHEDKELGPIYGIRAFPTDYPNILDRIAGRTGNAIWLHGTNKPLKAMDSSGCVALENDDIERVTRYITLNRTPIIVAEKLSYSPPAPRDKREYSQSSFRVGGSP